MTFGHHRFICGIGVIGHSIVTYNEAHVVSRMEASVALGLRKRRWVDWRDECMGQWMSGAVNRRE